MTEAPINSCLVCRDEPRVRNLLGPECRKKLRCFDGLCPEQIRSEVPVAGAAGWLVDRWGRPTPIAKRFVVGRRADLSIRAAQITRSHAELALHAGRWRIRDLGSRNGTFVNTTQVREWTVVSPGDQVRFGSVAFFLASDSPELRDAANFTVSVATGSAGRRAADAAPALAFGLQLLEPARGGGGLVCRGHGRIQLSAAQPAFVRWLFQSATTAADAEDAFVSSARLLAGLPFSTRTPNKDNLAQLVRMTRAKVKRLGLRIEGRRGRGYRLVEAR